MSDLSSHDSSLDTTDSPSIDMDNNNNTTTTTTNTTSKHTLDSSHLHSSCPEDLKQETNTYINSIHNNNNNNNNNNLLFTPNGMNSYDDLLFNTSNDIHSNQMDFLMMDLTQQTSSNGTAHINLSSPVLDFQNHLNGNINMTPSLNALTNGLFELNNSNPNTPHLPPLNIDANSHNNNSNNNNNARITTTTTTTTTELQEYSSIPIMPPVMPIMAIMPTMPIVNPIGDNIPPPTQDLDWQTFCTLINNNHNNTINTRKRKKLDTISTDTIAQIGIDIDINNDIDNDINNDNTPTKKRKLNSNYNIIHKKKKKKKRGRPRKNPEKISIKKEKKDKKDKRRKKKEKRNEYNMDEDEYNMDEYLASQYGTESYVGIRTNDGEVRIQIPPNPKCENSNYSKVKFTVFGNACSDKIEDILQPKKRTRYVRGLSEEEKKTRRREQNRNAAARSRARKNAMISKVIQLHQENMGLRAFVAENITQTKILRDEINRLNTLIMLQQQQSQSQQSQQSQQHIQSSSLFDIINQDSSTLFQNK